MFCLQIYFYLCVSVSQKDQKRCQNLRTGVIEGCKPSDERAGSQTCPLEKEQAQVLLSHHSSLCGFFDPISAEAGLKLTAILLRCLLNILTAGKSHPLNSRVLKSPIDSILLLGQSPVLTTQPSRICTTN